jgi:small subunit ribosomal protein S6
MRIYELTYIVKPDLDDKTLAALIERVNGMVTADGGKVIKLERWGLRQLSYPIRKYREGHYVFALLALPATATGRLEQRLRLTEDIIRHLLVRADKAEEIAEAPAQEATSDSVNLPATEDTSVSAA